MKFVNNSVRRWGYFYNKYIFMYTVKVLSVPNWRPHNK